MTFPFYYFLIHLGSQLCTILTSFIKRSVYLEQFGGKGGELSGQARERFASSTHALQKKVKNEKCQRRGRGHSQSIVGKIIIYYIHLVRRYITE